MCKGQPPPAGLSAGTMLRWTPQLYSGVYILFVWKDILFAPCAVVSAVDMRKAETTLSAIHPYSALTRTTRTDSKGRLFITVLCMQLSPFALSIISAEYPV